MATWTISPGTWLQSRKGRRRLVGMALSFSAAGAVTTETPVSLLGGGGLTLRRFFLAMALLSGIIAQGGTRGY